MPTHDPAQRLTVDAAQAWVYCHCFDAPSRPDRVGLEVEFLPVEVDPTGRPAGRASLRDLAGWLSLDPPVGEANPSGLLPGDTRLTFEPGAQLELSTSCHADAAGAARAAAHAVAAILPPLEERDVALAAAGIDPWHPVPPQQLPSSRYRSMATYLARRGGTAGAVMMRHTASLQINLDLGQGPAATQRWDVANLLSPLVAATFSSAAAPGVACLRGMVWGRTDPTRTGVPRALLHGAGDPAAQVTDALLAADVLLVPGVDGRQGPGRPGWTFGAWLRDGHPTHGWPTEADLRTHLSTWFPEARPRRGTVELRGIDALPARWRLAPVALLTAALYDTEARDHILGLLEPHRRTLPALHARCLREGLRDPAICALAVEVWSRARQGAVRSGDSRTTIATVDAFLDRFTTRGRAPADDLLELADDTAAALAWAREPIPLGVPA